MTIDFAAELAGFCEFGQPTRQIVTRSGAGAIPTFVNEFWTARQRQASSLHEVSYRACFKPQLPRFFIERLTDPATSCTIRSWAEARRPSKRRSLAVSRGVTTSIR